MKMIKLFLAFTLSLLTLPVYADNLAASLASQTSSIAKSTFEMAHDSVITTYIYAKLASHPELSDANIDISTNEGRVILNGIVNDDQQAQTITHLVQGTKGVKGVDASKIIISQRESPFAIKETVNAPASQNQESEDRGAGETVIVSPIADTQISSADPILTEKQASIPEKSQPEPQIKTEPQIGSPLKHTHKTKHHHKKKHAQTKKEKAAASKAKKVHTHKTKPRVKMKSLPAHQKVAPAQPVKKEQQQKKKHLPNTIKKQPLESRKNTPESVDQMTASFLKTALLANKEIPEE